MLYDKYDNEKLRNVLLPNKCYRPFPLIDNRPAWLDLDKGLQSKLVEDAEKYLNYEWPALYAAKYLEYKRTGNLVGYNDLYQKRRFALGTLVIAECVEDKGRFLDDIISGIWCICEESSWSPPANNVIVDNYWEPELLSLPDVTNSPMLDLLSCETAALLSWTHYLLRNRLDTVSKTVCERIRYEVKKRTLDVYLKRNDFWWMGYRVNEGIHLNNWVPWCTSNVVSAFLLLEDNPDRLREAVIKSMYSIDKFLGVYHDDGGCDEGPVYWSQAGASLFDYLELIKGASEGKIDVYNESIIKEIGRYIYRVHISQNYFVNFADSSARLTIPADLIYRYGKRIMDDNMVALGVHANKIQADKLPKANWYSMFRVLNGIFNYKEIIASTVTLSVDRDTWFDGIQVMVAREQENSDRGLYLAAKGGFNEESHNHNDVGNFIIYYDGKPVFIDVGVETYNAKTFSSHRYEIWTMQSAYHNLPTVNDIQQKDGEIYKSKDIEYLSDDSRAKLSMDIASVYPDKAGIEYWLRSISLNRGDEAYVEIIDDFKLNNSSDNITLSIMTVCCPMIDNEIGEIELDNGAETKLFLQFDHEMLEASSETILIEDKQLKEAWGSNLCKILFKAKTPIEQSKLVMRVSKLRVN